MDWSRDRRPVTSVTFPSPSRRDASTIGSVLNERGVQLTGRALLRPALLSPIVSVPVYETGRRISRTRLRFVLASLDAVAALTAVTLAVATRFGESAPANPTFPYAPVVLAVPLLWLATLSLAGVYEGRRLGRAGTELTRILNAGFWSLGILVFVSYATHADISRAVVAATIPTATGLTIAFHVCIAWLLRRRFRAGAALNRVLVVGSPREVQGLVDHLAQLPQTGIRVVGVCLPDRTIDTLGSLPVLGDETDAIAAAQAIGADTIAVAGSGVLSGAALRRLSWDVEGTGIGILISPSATELAGPRLVVQPVGGLPLLHVKEIEFAGVPRVVKTAMDRAGAAVLLIVLSPLLATLAVMVRRDTPGPVFFRQSRVGLHGRPFMLLKFRTMHVGADAEQSRLAHLNDHDGVLFKLRCDPRVTRVGRLLRRYSLDELPQLWNVLTGSMSLVGPRPPLESEVDKYPTDLRRRRLLVKPGITGPWQVGGRSDLSWEETVRLDLQYVENWSVGLDMLVMCRTLRAVVGGRGAY
jgi:exopolysaccharide biosynthesis polyprenyl glycosylphosphotransferase